MSYTILGYQGVTQTKAAPRYNAETKTYTFVREYQGSEAAVRGLEGQLRARGLSYRTDHAGPVWTLQVDDPVQDLDEDVDRWEIFTESTEKSIFELPDIILDAIAYDSSLDAGETPFKKACENAVETKGGAIESDPSGATVIEHLKAGAVGWQLDLVGLRRTRRLEVYNANSSTYQVTLDTGLLLYTTAQLGVPTSVAFGLPGTPADISTLFKWRWRKRSQRVEITGSYVEQTVELLFAPWSTLAYADAGVNLRW